MVRIPRSIALVGGFCTLLSATAAFAQSTQPSTGLGQSWPNAADVSASPHYHVYVFWKDGIRYFQINDLNGNVRAAIAVANHVVLVLPVGLDAATVVIGSQVSAKTSSGSETVYSDRELTLTATPQSDGRVVINSLVAQTCDTSSDCSLGSVAKQIGSLSSTQQQTGSNAQDLAACPDGSSTDCSLGSVVNNQLPASSGATASPRTTTNTLSSCPDGSTDCTLGSVVNSNTGGSH